MFSIHHNPANDVILIDTPEKMKEVNIYSVSGQKAITSQETGINIQSLSSDLYFVKITTLNQAFIRLLKKRKSTFFKGAF
ncbi:T9SS type A sorting domain-containing protein [Chryseobacterium indologenes]|uniref:T9SS type A sorting domain-containing protein n=1 Tax=Chryseobacterium indologenes TaxID=253 RepID=UPI00374D9277